MIDTGSNPRTVTHTRPAYQLHHNHHHNHALFSVLLRHSRGALPPSSPLRQKCHQSGRILLSCFCCFILRHFDGLKICFLKFPETLDSRFRGYRWTHILHFGGLKKRFLAGR
jgi:hypothetical protein